MGTFSFHTKDNTNDQESRIEIRCPLCRELAALGGSRLSHALGDPRTRNVILAQSDSLTLIPSIGPLVAGHVLVVPKKHQCELIGSADKDCLTELSHLLQSFWRTCEKVGKDDFELLCFEHGSSSEDPNRVLCSTNHAHLHVLPVPFMGLQRLFGDLSMMAKLESSRLGGLASRVSELEEYVVLFSMDEHLTVKNAVLCDGSIVPSQFCRKKVAEFLGKPEWDWKKESNVKDLSRTVKLGVQRNIRVISNTDFQ